GGAIASYQWFSQTLSISSSATATPRIVNPPVGEHLVRLTVTDSNYVEASSAFIVTVLPANQPPVAVFDIPDTVYYGDVVQLDGTQSYDADGYISRYEWYFNDWTSRYSTVLLSADDYQPGENTVRLQVRDNGGAYGELEKSFVVLMDSDRDGVLDDSDLCPGTSAGSSTDEYGCSVANVMAVCPANPVSSDDAFRDNYPEDDIDYIGHSYHSVRDIERAFNHARHTDNSVTQYLKMPSQQQWDALTLQQQGLYLVNAERRSRGLKPFSVPSDEVAQVAQQYANLILNGNAVISHYYVDENGNHTPHDRLAENDIIGE